MQGMCKDFHQLRVKTMPAPLIKTGKCLRRVTFNEYLQWANCRKRSFLPSICVEKFSHLANVLYVVLRNLSSLWQLVRHKRNKLQQKCQLLVEKKDFSRTFQEASKLPTARVCLESIPRPQPHAPLGAHNAQSEVKRFRNAHIPHQNFSARLCCVKRNNKTFPLATFSVVSGGARTNNAGAWRASGRRSDINPHRHLHCDFREDKKQGEVCFTSHCQLSFLSKQNRRLEA